MTCHCGSCEDHRMDSWNMFDHDSVQWTEATLDEVKGELFDARKTPIQKSVEKVVEMQEERDGYDEAPDPYSQWVENTQYMTKEELADRYARFGTALAEIHKMALDSFSGKDLPEPKYMLGLCLGLAGGALNYEKPKQ